MKLTELKACGEAPEWMTEEGLKTLNSGYLLENETPKQMYQRVSKAAASYYKNANELEERFFDIIWKNWLCLSSPILSNSGTNRGLNISCNAAHISDSIDSIFMKNHELAVLSKNGAGVSLFLGELRPRGSKISGNGVSDGIVSWAKCFDSTIAAVNQGCYDQDTELLTEKGWDKFSNLKLGTKVAQVDTKGHLSFVDFTDYTCYSVNEELYKFTNETASINLLVTGNHRMALEKRKRIFNKRDKNGKFLNNTKKITGFLEITEAQNTSVHRDNQFWVAAKSANGVKQKLSSLDQFLIAYQADGATNPSGNSTGEISGTLIYNFHFSKQRKIIRLCEILDNLNWYYTKNIQKDETTNISVRVPIAIKLSKKLSDMFDFTEFSSDYAKQFIEEVGKWDAHENIFDNHVSIAYSCVFKENIDFIQATSFIAGKMSTLGKSSKKEDHHQLRHHIYICERNSVGGESVNKTKEFYNGNVYCISVPTGLLVVRRNGAIAICGNSTRRGAASLYVQIRHPDLEEFLYIRRQTGDINRRCTNINIGITIDNQWMEELIAGDKEKRRIWGAILKERVETGEPYLFFSDNVNNNNPECYKANNLIVKTSNICTEITLYTDPEHTFVCCLSSLNLAKWDEWKDTDTVNLTVRFLDAVLSEYVEKAQHIKGMENAVRSAIKGRAIGIGVLGWHSLLQSKSLPFDSFDTMMLNAEIFSTIKKKAEEETKILAEELGEPEWCKGFNRRNSHLIALAPTVSNSTISGGFSPSIEPIPSNIFAQKSAKGTFIIKNKALEAILKLKNQNTTEVWDSINENSGSVQHLTFLSDHEKEVFLTAREINQHTIIKLAAQRQKWIDQAQSVNLFFAKNSTAKYIHEVHINAWKSGLKTLYYFRSEGVIKGDLASRSESECKACEG